MIRISSTVKLLIHTAHGFGGEVCLHKRGYTNSKVQFLLARDQDGDCLLQLLRNLRPQEMSLQLRAISLARRACLAAAMQRTLGATLRHVHHRPRLPPKSGLHTRSQGIVQHRIEHSKQHPAKIQSREKGTGKNPRKLKNPKKKRVRVDEEFKEKMLTEELRNRRVLDRFLDQGEWAGRLYPERPRDASGNLLPLTDEQNVFFTGPAGSGKSMLLRELITALEEKYPTRPNRVQVCVLTGLVKEQAWGKNLKEARVVVLDNISMMRPGDFVRLDRDARTIRNNNTPFGGLQIVATGDFAQQGFVPEPGKNQSGPEPRNDYCFETPAWLSIKHQVRLSTVFRQKDPAFVNMLNETGEGRISEHTAAGMKELARPLGKGQITEPTAIVSWPKDADEVNRTRLSRLQRQGWMYRAVSYRSQNFTKTRSKLFLDCIVPSTLELKPRAQVMLIKNLADPRLTIGTIG